MFRGQLMLASFLIWAEVREIIKTRNQNSKKPKNSSRIRRFTRREAIQFIPKFAFANLMRINKLLTEYSCNQYNVNHKITLVILE